MERFIEGTREVSFGTITVVIKNQNLILLRPLKAYFSLAAVFGVSIIVYLWKKKKKNDEGMLTFFFVSIAVSVEQL